MDFSVSQPNLSYLLKGIYYFFGCSVGYYLALLSYRYIVAHTKIARKQKEVQKKFDEHRRYLDSCNINSETVKEITEMSIHNLKESIVQGKFSVSDVLRSFQVKALEVHDRLNCLTEPIKESFEEASKLDNIPKSEIGLLHGIPVSIKDNYNVKGYDTTCGFVVNLFQPASDDAVLVKVLKSQGAIPFVKTNNPQTLLSFDCHNYIYGQTLNPHSSSHAPGGSSGGEACLVAGKGSILGWGTDIGGSLRIPAMFCGLYTLKPSSMRVSKRGRPGVLMGETTVVTSTGPIARDVDTLVLGMKAVLCPKMFELDTAIPPIPFRNELYELGDKKLRIAYYKDDGAFAAVPSCQRAVDIAVDALKNAGHTLIEWKPPNLDDKISYYISSLFGDGGYELLDPLRFDRISYSITMLYLTLKVPFFLKNVLGYLLKPFMPLATLALFSFAKIRSVKDWWDHTKEVINLRDDISDEWNEKGFDALVCPGFGCPALPIGYPTSCLGAITYTALFNVLNFVAGTVPVTNVIESDIDELKKTYPVKDIWHYKVKQGTLQSNGLPVCVQCVTLPYQEELCLFVMKQLETQLNKSQ